MNRRFAWQRLAAGALALGPAILTAGCGAGSTGGGPTGWLSGTSHALARGAALGRKSLAGEPQVRLPARQLSLSLADLPAGFRVADEVAPALNPEQAADDPWGRRSAYSVTFAGLPAAAWRDVVSSINAYSEAKHAHSAFASWQEAMPAAYRRLPPVTGLGEEAAVYVRPAIGVREGATCLVGLRRGNVLASVSVGGVAGAEAPTEAALSLARVIRAKIEAGLAAR